MWKIFVFSLIPLMLIGGEPGPIDDVPAWFVHLTDSDKFETEAFIENFSSGGSAVHITVFAENGDCLDQFWLRTNDGRGAPFMSVLQFMEQAQSYPQKPSHLELRQTAPLFGYVRYLNTDGTYFSSRMAMNQTTSKNWRFVASHFDEYDALVIINAGNETTEVMITGFDHLSRPVMTAVVRDSLEAKEKIRYLASQNQNGGIAYYELAAEQPLHIIGLSGQVGGNHSWPILLRPFDQ